MEASIAVPYVKDQYVAGDQYSIKIYDIKNNQLDEKKLLFKDGFAYMEDYCLKKKPLDPESTENCVKNTSYVTYGFEYVEGAMKAIFYKGNEKLSEALIQI